MDDRRRRASVERGRGPSKRLAVSATDRPGGRVKRPWPPNKDEQCPWLAAWHRHQQELEGQDPLMKITEEVMQLSEEAYHIYLQLKAKGLLDRAAIRYGEILRQERESDIDKSDRPPAVGGTC